MSENKAPSGMNIWQKMSEIQKDDLEISKDKQAHGYRYAPLDAIMDKLSPLLHKHGLILYHETDYDKETTRIVLRTFVKNVINPDEFIVSTSYINPDVKLQGQNEYMVNGSAITYFRRYHVTSMFGLTTEEDTDAGGAKGSRAVGGKSVDNAGGEKEVDFVAIFKNMVDKGKTKDVLEKQLSSYKSKMSEEQFNSINKLIEEL